jgi:AcrR family transcriptional regulator
MVVATRSVPRQRRSEVSIDLLVEAGARVIDRVGAAATTTALIAAEANVSVGRVYYWFPHVEALVDVIALRAAQRMTARIERIVRPLGVVPIDVAVVGLVDEVATSAWAHPGVVALLLDTTAFDDVAPLRDALGAAVNSLLTAHVPTIGTSEASVVAAVVVELLVGLAAASVIADPAKGSELEREMAYAATAYLATRFPAPGDALWVDPTHPVRPSRSASSRAWSRNVLDSSPH